MSLPVKVTCNLHLFLAHSVEVEGSDMYTSGGKLHSSSVLQKACIPGLHKRYTCPRQKNGILTFKLTEHIRPDLNHPARKMREDKGCQRLDKNSRTYSNSYCQQNAAGWCVCALELLHIYSEDEASDFVDDVNVKHV